MILPPPNLTVDEQPPTCPPASDICLFHTPEEKNLDCCENATLFLSSFSTVQFLYSMTNSSRTFLVSADMSDFFRRYGQTHGLKSLCLLETVMRLTLAKTTSLSSREILATVFQTS